MAHKLSDAARKIVWQISHEAQASREIVDAHAVAAKVRQNCPEEVISTDDIAQLILNSSIEAIEFSPPALVIEIILPPASQEAAAMPAIRSDLN